MVFANYYLLFLCSFNKYLFSATYVGDYIVEVHETYIYWGTEFIK